MYILTTGGSRASPSMEVEALYSRLSGVGGHMDSPSSRIRSSFEQLSKTAKSLNLATDRLNLAVLQLDESLKSLNLGVFSWVTYRTWGEGPESETEAIGYAKYSGKWGICLRRTFEDLSRLSPDPDDLVDITIWTFSEAPREMRIRAISHVEKLINQLNSDVKIATEDIGQRCDEAETLASAINELAKETAPVRPVRRSNAGGK